jgi:multisubunit Na+/H+ antiporter MnhB subunit
MPPGLGHTWGVVVTVVLLLFIVYRRFRRLFGRQPLNPKRMVARILILCVVGALLSPAALRSSAAALAMSAGLVLGVAIGLWGAKHTRYEWHGGELHYVPHTYAGLVVSALFLGRLLYRVLILSQGGLPADAGSGQANPFGTIYQNPLTLSVFFVLIGYYVCYFGYVLWEFKQGRHAQLAPGAVVNPSTEERNKPQSSVS